jgi:hypothetical protein
MKNSTIVYSILKPSYSLYVWGDFIQYSSFSFFWSLKVLLYSKKSFQVNHLCFFIKTIKLNNVLDIGHKWLVVRNRLVGNSSVVLVVDNSMPVVAVGTLLQGTPLLVAGKDSGRRHRPAVVENYNKKKQSNISVARSDSIYSS